MSEEPQFPMDRRRFLATTVWSTLATTVTLQACSDGGEGGGEPRFDPSTIPEDPERFDLGVQAGLTGTGALLWTHRTVLGPLELRVWVRDGDLVLDSTVDSESHFVKAAVDGLIPGERYDYAFVSSSQASPTRSAVGGFRVPPEASSLEPLTLAASACTHPSRMPFVALEETARHDFDLFCHLGDISYNDDATDRASYDAAWRTTLGDPGYRALLPRAAFIPVMDDHEIGDNFVVSELPAQQLADGLAALYDHLPIDGAPGDPLWRSHRWGRTAELFVVDGRLERRREQDQFVGEEQLTWLIEGLQASPCHFKIVLNAVPIAQLPPVWPAFSDRWEAFEAQREALLDAITEGALSNVWFLTGDLHAGLVHRLERSGPRSGLLEVMVGPGGPRTLNPLPTLVEQVPTEAEAYFPSDQFIFRSDALAATLLTFDPATDQVRVQFMDPQTGEARFDELLHSGAS